RQRPGLQFAAAVAKTLPAGELIVLDSAGYGPVTITQSISIITPPGVYAGITVFSGDGITVNSGTGTVRLVGLTINGLGGDNGIVFNSGNALYLDNVTISGFGGVGSGLAVAVGTTSSVYIVDS